MSCTYTLCLADFECLVLSELVIDCVSALLKLAEGFRCWHGTLLEWSMPRACVEGQSASQGGGGVVRGTLVTGTVFGSMRACFWESGQICMLMFVQLNYLNKVILMV